jgi:ABC-2 type transport system permease protein
MVPSFGPMQFAGGGAFRLIALWGHLALGLAWTAAFTVTGLVIFRVKTRNRSYRATLSRLPLPTGSERV